MLKNSIHKIKNEEITFVIQGPIINENSSTKNSCKSIRKYFPNSKIILSTWKHSKTEDLEYDQKVESIDPESTENYFLNKEIPNNINRQIISSYNGIKEVKTKFTVKIRSDMYFVSDKLLNLLYYVDSSISSYSKRKIIIPSNMAINPDRDYKLLFHPSDAFFAGLTDDIAELFNIPLMDNHTMTFFKINKKNIKNDLNLLPKYTSEQYIFCSFLKKKNELDFKNAFDNSPKNRTLHNKIFTDLFFCKRNSKIGVNCYKHPMSYFSSTLYYAYSENEFKKLSNNHSIFDFERFISNFIRIIKSMLFFLSKRFFYKIKNFFIEKI